MRSRHFRCLRRLSEPTLLITAVRHCSAPTHSTLGRNAATQPPPSKAQTAHRTLNWPCQSWGVLGSSSEEKEGCALRRDQRQMTSRRLSRAAAEATGSFVSNTVEIQLWIGTVHASELGFSCSSWPCFCPIKPSLCMLTWNTSASSPVGFTGSLVQRALCWAYRTSSYCYKAKASLFCLVEKSIGEGQENCGFCNSFLTQNFKPFFLSTGSQARFSVEQDCHEPCFWLLPFWWIILRGKIRR